MHMSKFLSLIPSALLLLPLTVFAQTPSGGGTGSPSGGGTGSPSGGGFPNPLGDLTIITFFQALLDVVMIFAVPIIVFFIIYAGFLYVTARGNQETISRAHRALTYAVIGGLLILGANVLIQVIQGTVSDVGGGTL